MFLKDLCQLNGVSGNENSVREYIIENIKGRVDSWNIDKIGNIVAQKKGESDNQPNVLICAHMDEVGLFITEITSEGFLKFQTVGGIDPRILISKIVISSNDILGVIGSKAIHLQKKEERKQSQTVEELYIDIGANTKDEAEQVIGLGDYFVFLSKFESLGPELYKAKAFDNRVGCAIIMEILANRFDCNLIAAFTVQEEVGLRGSRVISNYLQADLAIVIEATMATDFQETCKEDWIVELGKGPACSFMDSATIYKSNLIDNVINTAKKGEIPLQLRLGVAAVNDAGNIHLAGIGIPTITISIPCRNIHSMNSVIAKKDYQDCINLLKNILIDIRNFISN